MENNRITIDGALPFLTSLFKAVKWLAELDYAVTLDTNDKYTRSEISVLDINDHLVYSFTIFINEITRCVEINSSHLDQYIKFINLFTQLNQEDLAKTATFVTTTRFCHIVGMEEVERKKK